METTAQRDQDLHKGVSGNLNQADYPSTPESVNPNDQSALTKIPDGKLVDISSGDLSHFGRGAVEEWTSGKGVLTRTRVTSSKNPISLALERLKKVRLKNNKAA
ncbi:hypothetical protein HY384_04020 [Candidatus Daviesbacteria bacterium]|nr:hypothetical protein [Candidatus Daviesbacteria bacterium]